ncbi:hypothetical protein FRB96_009672 [Tulasnella sp. 330]|nr:hypothetical protein FRB96_009672 [Tulasnella sp. 330]
MEFPVRFAASGPHLPLASPALEYPPITPPHLTHSRRGSRESRESSSSQSTPSTGASGPNNTHGGLVHRHKRGHASSSMSPPSPSTALRKSRKPKKKDQVEEPDEEVLSDDGGDQVGNSKLRREDAKKSRQDAEQKRRDQLKGAYDQLRLVVPGSTDKTSKVMLVNHARQHIEKLSRDKHDLLVRNERIEDDLQGLRLLNERLLKKLLDHRIDFKDDLEATGMELPPAEEVQRVLQPAPMMSNLPMTSAGGHPQPPQSTNQFTQHRSAHSRNSSTNISIHNFGSDSSLSGSTSSHSVPLANYAPLPGSAPLTPMRPSMMMGPPSSQPGMAPQVQVTLPGGIHVPSPTSSLSPGSAASVGRQQIFPSDGQMRYPVDEHGTNMAMGPSMMGMEQGDYMRHRQPPPHRPPHQTNGHHAHAFNHPGMGPPGASVQRNGSDGQMADHERTVAGLTPAGHDSQLNRSMSHPGSSAFMNQPGVPPYYPDGSHDPSHFSSDYVQYSQDDRHPPSDMYLPASSPGSGSQAHTPQASSQQGPQPHLLVPQHTQGLHPQHLIGPGHGMVPPMAASPHHSDRSGAGHSPLIGSFSEGNQHQLSDAGINPSMIMGEVGGSDQPMMAPGGPEAGSDGRSIPGSWYASDTS